MGWFTDWLSGLREGLKPPARDQIVDTVTESRRPGTGASQVDPTEYEQRLDAREAEMTADYLANQFMPQPHNGPLTPEAAFAVVDEGLEPDHIGHGEEIKTPEPSLWSQIVDSHYKESVLDYGNMHSNHGPDQDRKIADQERADRAARTAQLAEQTGVPEHTIHRLAANAANSHGFAPDADYIDYLAEPNWEAVREGTYQARDPWAGFEPEWDEDELDRAEEWVELDEDLNAPEANVRER